jgi:hypothetical protein
MPLTSAFATCALLLLATILALVREVRLRLALQRLLVRLLVLWGNRHAKNSAPSAAGHDRDGPH